MDAIKDKIKNHGINNLQSGTILEEVVVILRKSTEVKYTEQILLSLFQELIYCGYLAWGSNLANPSPPFFHITERGKLALKNLDRDPSNPNEYLIYIEKSCELKNAERSYLYEALNTFNAGYYKSAAVMIGAAAECFIFKLRDSIALKMNGSNKLSGEWMAKSTFNKIKKILDKKSNSMPIKLREEYTAYWSALNEQIRRARNDAGHPENISLFTYEDVHASLLIFPSIAKLTAHLMNYIKETDFLD